MKSIRNSVAAGSCHVFGLALLVLSATAGGSAVRAADPSVLQNVVFDPIAQLVLRVEQRIADLESTVAAFAGSFTSERVVAQQLCVADGGGAQTCITKAQLDALIKGAAQVGQTSARIELDADAQAAAADKSVPSAPTVGIPSETSPAIEPPAAAVGDTGTSPAVAAVVPPAIERPASAADESAPSMPEAAAPMPSATPSSFEQPAAAAGESGTPLAALATVMPPPTEPVEAVIAATAKPETVIAVEQPAEHEEPAPAGPAMASSPETAPALNAVPAEEQPARERLE
jgi:hypothetical protein